MPTQTPIYNMSNLLKVLCSLTTSSASRLFRHAGFWACCYSKTPLLQAQGLNSDRAWLQGHSYTTTLVLWAWVELSLLKNPVVCGQAHFSALLWIVDVEYPSVIFPCYQLYVGALNPSYWHHVTCATKRTPSWINALTWFNVIGETVSELVHVELEKHLKDLGLVCAQLIWDRSSDL